MFEEHPGHWFSTPEKREDRALAWAERNKNRLLHKSAVTFRDVTRGFFSRGGAWERRMVQKGRHYQNTYILAHTGYLENHLIPLFGDMLPRDMTRRYIDDKIATTTNALNGKPLSGPTKQKIVDALSIIFEELVDMGICDRNPTIGLTRYSMAPTLIRTAIPRAALEVLFPPTHEGLLRVWGTPMYSALFCYLHDVGCRPGEARALTWSEWNAAERFVSIRHGVRSGTVADIKGTKSNNVRPAFVSERTKIELAIWRDSIPELHDTDFVFCRQDTGTPISTHTLCDAFRAGIVRAGFGGEPWTPYYLRHSFGTHYLNVLDDKELMVLMGHSSIITSAIYRHPDDELILERSRGLRDKLDSTRE